MGRDWEFESMIDGRKSYQDTPRELMFGRGAQNILIRRSGRQGLKFCTLSSHLEIAPEPVFERGAKTNISKAGLDRISLKTIIN